MAPACSSHLADKIVNKNFLFFMAIIYVQLIAGSAHLMTPVDGRLHIVESRTKPFDSRPVY